MLDQPSKSTHPNMEVRSQFITALELLKSNRRAEAVNVLETTIMEGCTDSMVLLGTLFTDGNKEERKRSIHLFKMAAERGNNSGMRNLGYCYAIGLNVEKDKEKGAQLYIESAKAGNARSACNIGVMYDYGNGVDQDYERAFYWYTLSAEGGYSRGMTNLGEYYLWGRGTEKDIDTAIRWFESSGSPRAIYRLYEIYSTDGAYHNQSKALFCLEKSAALGYSKSIIAMARRLKESDPEKALDYYLAAARKGNQEAVDYLTEHGIPVPESDFSRRRKKSTE